MTVNTISNKVTATGDGVSTVYNINFQFYIKSDLIVTFTDVVQSPSSYNVTGGAGSTGVLTFLSPPPNGAAIVIARVLPIVQQAAFTRNDPFPAKTHEIALDRLVMMLQQIEGGSGGGGSVSPEFIQDTVAAMFGGANTGISFTYDDTNGILIATVTSPGLPDAPMDSIYYVRRNGNWIEMNWVNIQGKPSTFPPDPHTHTSSQITDLTENTQDLVGPMFVHAGHTNISFTYDDITGTMTAVASAGATTSGTAPYIWDDTSTAMADPGTGKIRGTGTTMDSHTAFAVSNTDNAGNLPNMAALVVGDTIIISNNTRAAPGKYAISTKTINPTWTQFGVAADSAYSTGNPLNGDSLDVGGVVTSGGGGAGIPEAPNDGHYYTRKSLGWSQGLYSDLTGIPSSFPPNPHTHVIADITDYPTDLVHGPASVTSGRVAAFSGTSGTIIAQGTKLETDLVVGPASSVSGRVATFNGTGGKTIQDGGVLLSNLSQTGHTHVIGDVTNLQTTLDAKETLGEYIAINAQTGTTYTLALTDKGKLVTGSNASAQTYTVPPNSSVAFPVKSKVDLAQVGTGQITIAAGAGVTIRSSGAKLKLTGQYSGVSLTKLATDEWLLVGDLTT